MSSSAPLLEARGISKSFPGAKALSGVNLAVRAGEVHALMGENGAGKSTLIKVLTGVYPRDAGDIHLAGEPIHPRSTLEAQHLGISTVYQEVNLIPQLSVAENIALGRQPVRFGCVRWGEMERRARNALARLGVTVDVSLPLASYSIAIQQLVAIARALDLSCKLLILDEPTSSLDAREVERLFAVLRKLKAEGLGILFVTHFLDQVYAIADRITILRNGQNAGEFETARLPRLELVSRMIGKSPEELGSLSRSPTGAADRANRPVFLQAERLGKRGSIAPFDLIIRESEIVGLAGLLGSGRTELARLLFGIDLADTGALRIQGQPRSISSARDAIDAGLGFCPEDRKADGIIPNLSVRENIVLALQGNRGWVRFLSSAQQEEIAERFIRALRITPSDPERPIQFLSGGNQQKVLLARWLAAHPRLLILDEPTRGIDVGAKFEIEKLMSSLASEGMAILFISSELEEVIRSSDRVVILRDRAVVAELSGGEISEAAVLAAIAAPAHSTGAALPDAPNG